MKHDPVKHDIVNNNPMTLHKMLPLFSWILLAGLCGCRPSLEHNDSIENLWGKQGLFHDILSLVDDYYVETPSPKILAAGAMNGMLHTLDPYCEYYTKEGHDMLTTFLAGEFGGIGAEISMTSDGVEVVSPLEKGPAAKAGLKPGDRLLKVNGLDILSMTPLEFLRTIHGVPGTWVTLTLISPPNPVREVRIQREIIQDHPLEMRCDEDVAYIRLSSFHGKTKEQLITSVQKIRNMYPPKGAKKLKGVILDVRNNPGGTLDQALAVAEVFLKYGSPIVTIDSKDPALNRTFNSQGRDYFDGATVIILINRGSASASEVLAGALHDNKRAVLMGERTYGKGSVQRLFDLGDRGAVKLTTAYFKTPNGTVIQKNGLKPDVECALCDEKTAPHTENLPAKKSPKDTLIPNKDPLIEKARDMIRSLWAIDKKDA